MLNAETAQVLIALITTGGTVAVAWFNYRSHRPPELPHGKRRPISTKRSPSRRKPKRNTLGS